MGPFDEFIGRDQPLELGIVDEMIVDILALARPHRPSRGADRHGDLAVGFQQHPADGRFAGARRRGEDDQEAAAAAGRMIASSGPWPLLVRPPVAVKRRIVHCTKIS